jgi:hypothetical protein
MAERVVAFMFDAGFGLFHMQVFGVRGTRHAIQANAFFCRRQITSEFGALGHEVRLATMTPCSDDSGWTFDVIRQPRLGQFLHLLRWCDVHMQANVSLKFGLARLLRPHSFVYSHHNVYRRDDGTLDLRGRIKGFVARRTPGIANSRYTAGKLGCTRVIFNAYDDATFRDDVAWQALAALPARNQPSCNCMECE